MSSGRFAKWRDATPIRAQISLLLCAVVALLCAALIIYSYAAQRGANLRHEATAIDRVLELEGRQLDSYIDELSAFSLQLRNDSSVMSILTQRGEISYAQQQTLENAFRTQFYSRDDISWMELYLIRSQRLLRLDNPRRKVRTMPYRDPQTLEDYAAFSAPPGYLSIRHGDEGFLEVTRTIIDSPRTTPLAVVRFLVDAGMPGRFIDKHAENDERLYLFDASGTSLTDDGHAAAVLAAVRSGDAALSLDAQSMLLVTGGPGSYGFTAAVVKPMSAINAALNRTRNITIAVAAGALIVLSLLLIAAVRQLISPLEALAARMRRAGQGEFKEQADLRGSAEMVGLSRDLNRMTESISSLIDRTYVASLNERTAQLAALEAQTNPHFLFNTLQAIGSEALAAGDQQAYRMITSLGALLRYSIKGGNLAPLSVELEYVGKYLALQKARFGDRLQYDVQADPALLDREVPKLGLLALVENAIVHGMKGPVESIRLSIACGIEDGAAVFRVTDDGAGMSPERLAAVRRSLEDDAVVVTGNIGLGNLSSRLRLLYEGRARLEVDSAATPARRTAIQFYVPMEVLKDVQDADRR